MCLIFQIGAAYTDAYPHIRITTEVLGATVKQESEAPVRQTEIDRTGKGIVNDQNQPMRLGKFDQSFENGTGLSFTSTDGLCGIQENFFPGCAPFSRRFILWRRIVERSKCARRRRTQGSSLHILFLEIYILRLTTAQP